MIAIKQGARNDLRVMWVAVGLALCAALAYVLIAWNVLAVGDLQTGEEPAGIVYAAAASYLLGGLLILLRIRWLWITGAVINALVILFFLMMYLNRTAVLFSPGGLLTKAAQILLEVSLLFLIITNRERGRTANR